jgi:hypothetical protein
MELILPTLTVVWRHAASISLFTACVLWGAALMAAVVQRKDSPWLEADDLLSLAAGAWIVPSVLAAAAAFLGSLVLGIEPRPWILAGAAISLAASLALIGNRRRRLFSRASVTWALALCLLFLATALARLAFLTRTALPLYFDSATHYDLIRQLLEGIHRLGGAFRPTLPSGAYYHLGYHVLLAALADLAATDVASLMLTSGQMALALISLSMYLLVHRATGSRFAGLSAVLLGSFGWYMPGHAVNWGKYPALFSLLAILSAVNLAYLACEASTEPPRRRGLAILALASACVAVALHTRSLVVLVIIVIAWRLSGRWRAATPTRQRLALAAVLALTAGLGAYLLREPLLGQALHPYLGAGVSLTLAAGVLFVFSILRFPRMAFASWLVLTCLLAALLLPAPVARWGSLLDRPLVEIVLFLPLTIIAALGAAGLRLSLPPLQPRIAQALVVLTWLAVSWNAAAAYGFYPSSCCALARAEDVVALDWMQSNLPPDEVIAISSRLERVDSGTNSLLEAPTDAGAWIHPLARLATVPLSYAADFSDPAIRAEICVTRAHYIYAGSTEESFSRGWLDAEPDWYRLRLRLPEVSVYEVIGCPR